MRRFWDAKAREDALYFINNTLEYGNADSERFWASGPADVDMILGRLGVELAASDTVVEIGCGIGRMTRPLAERSASVKALDVSTEMIARAREENPQLDNVEWIVGDGSSLAGVGDASADACISFVVFQHIPEPDAQIAYIREMGRVLRPGGWAGFQISDLPDVHVQRPLLRRARERVAAMRGRLPHGWSHPAWRGSNLELDRLGEVATDAGMSVEHVDGAGTQFCFVLLRRV
jgi:SAM-dependent methyltransferase